MGPPVPTETRTGWAKRAGGGGVACPGPEPWARRWYTSTGWAKRAGGAGTGVEVADPGLVSCAGAGLRGDPTRPRPGTGPVVSRVTGGLGHSPSEGHGVAVPARNNGKGGWTTGLVGNIEDRSRSRVEVGVVVVEKGKTDSSNTTWREMRMR